MVEHIAADNRNRPTAGLVIFILISLLGCSSTPQNPQVGSMPHAPGVDLYVQGAQQLDRGETDQAVATLASAIQVNPNLISPRSLLGDIYRSRNQYALAADQYHALVELDPYEPKNDYYLGLCYQFLDRVKDAVASYLRALHLNPSDAKSNMNLGLAYLALGKPDDAIRYIEKATQIDPNSAEAWANLGVALDSKGETLTAENAYRKSIELDSNQAATMVNLGANLLQQGKDSGAIAILQEAIKRQDSALARKFLGDAFQHSGRNDDAIAQYQQAVKLDPNYAPALNALANSMIAKYESGSELDDALRQGAVDSWKKSLSTKPQQPQIASLIQKWDRPSPPK
jgi:tetratricopeptide (TPR) repeat protein